MAGFHTPYSARGVLVNYANVDITEGKSDDVYLTISRNSPRISTRVGGDGRYSTALSPDRGVTVVLSFFPESNSAKIMAAVYEALVASDTLGAIRLDITDPSGSINLIADEAALSEEGGRSYGGDSGTVDYTFIVPEAALFPLEGDAALSFSQAREALSI
tara:strand:- start:31553 stop:32032 length:480 start_codon:yes stop_codon:yes gene_type:complete